MTSWRRSTASRRPPRRARDAAVDRSAYEMRARRGGARPLDRARRRARAVAIDTETDCIDCIIAELVGVSLALAPNKACYIPLGHGGSDMFPSAEPVPMDAGARRAEAAARGRGGPQDRAEHQVRHQHVRKARHRRRAGRRHDGDELRSRRRGASSAATAWTSWPSALRPQLHDLQGIVRHRQEADPLRRGAARPGDRICRRGCRRHLRLWQRFKPRLAAEMAPGSTSGSTAR